MPYFVAGRRWQIAILVLLVLCTLFLIVEYGGHYVKILLPQSLKTPNVSSNVYDGRPPSLAPSWNRPPVQHVAEPTPLFIGFTRNWSLLQQAVVSYIAAGWPPLDIYVVDNTGAMQSNALNQLTPTNPFYLDYEYLTHTLGVNVLTTPTYLSFAQLQNFFLFTSTTNHWPHYFWSHMDVAALTDELYDPFSSLYNRAVDALREAQTDPAWGIRFFAYDHLTLANTAAYTAVGGFDTFIPFYTTDCDFHFRLSQAEYTIRDAVAGHIFDVGDSLPNPTLFFRQDTTETRASCQPEDIEAASTAAVTDLSEESTAYGRADCRFHALLRLTQALDDEKQAHKGGRNFWQVSQTGGEGEPFWQNPAGFEEGLQMQMEFGKEVYRRKWKHEGCDLKKAGRTCRDAGSCSAWRVEED